jgi:preprotein translocase subunit SecE
MMGMGWENVLWPSRQASWMAYFVLASSIAARLIVGGFDELWAGVR